MSDFFDTMKTKPKSSASAVSSPLGSGNPEISVLDIQNFISPKLYGELSWDENRTADEVTKDCIERAIIDAETLLHLLKQELNLYSETQKAIVKTLTIYELYIYNGDKFNARTWMEKAERLISNRYGSLDKAKEEQKPVISLSNTKKEKRGKLWM